MDDLLWPSISSAIDETIASLDRLQQTEEARQAEHLRDLRASVAGLDFGSPAEAEPTDVRPERAPVPPGRPYVPLPQRTTHGGPWGPAVRERLRAVALAKRGGGW
jgi:hypothetical protein